MRLYTIEHAGRVGLGIEADEQLAIVEGAGLPADMAALIAAGPEGLAAVRQVSQQRTARIGFADVRILAPLRPGKILCSGVNYLGHLTENPGAVLPETPGFFSKLPSAVIGPGEPIVHPTMTTQLDYEIELSVVIGRRLRRASERDAMAGIFGYTLLHDVSARDVQFRAPQPNQITLGKNFDTFAPLGPCIVTPDELGDPANVRLRTFVNGQLLQDGTTADWVFQLPYLISFLSQIMTLEPGDIVTTGTPAGVGVFRNPQVFLKPGDHVVLEADGIGRLENPVVAEESA
jgi:2,4-diketo-3-deoxy-L-fuconate hydrolase